MKDPKRKCNQEVRTDTAGSSSFRDFDHLPEILTAKELQHLLRIDTKTIYGYVQRGLIPYVRIQSNLRFRKRKILNWIEEHSYTP